MLHYVLVYIDLVKALFIESVNIEILIRAFTTVQLCNKVSIRFVCYIRIEMNTSSTNSLQANSLLADSLQAKSLLADSVLTNGMLDNGLLVDSLQYNTIHKALV